MTGDPAFDGAFSGKGDALGGGRLRVAGGAAQQINAGDRVDNARIAWDLPSDGIDMTGMWTRDDYGIPEGSYTEIGAYRIGKPAGSHLVIKTSGAKLSLYLRRAADAAKKDPIGVALDSGTYTIDDPDECVYGLLIGPSGKQHGTRSLGYDLETWVEPAAETAP